MRMAEKEFEGAFKKLENIVEKLEAEDLSLDESLKSFEEGIRLARLCGKKLNEAEKKIEILLKDAQGTEKTESFDPDDAKE